tara:strand:- start:141 stop:242 length:102 start_codon:yes stop_codon:yes gene_type:complete
MDKNNIGKMAGVGGAIAVIITVVCQLFHAGGVP